MSNTYRHKKAMKFKRLGEKPDDFNYSGERYFLKRYDSEMEDFYKTNFSHHKQFLRYKKSRIKEEEIEDFKKAEIFDKVEISDSTKISGDARRDYGDAEVSNNAKVSGNTWV